MTATSAVYKPRLQGIETFKVVKYFVEVTVVSFFVCYIAFITQKQYY